MTTRILFVDDERNILDGLQRMLRPMRHHWTMSFVSSGNEALVAMQEQPFDVIVSDMRMPGMDGVELLTTVRKRYPETVRLVLSGHSDKETFFKAISPAHQYLTKPCSPDTLKQTIERALTLRQLLSRESLKKLVTQIRLLPSLPHIYLELLHELQSSDGSLKRVGSLIEQDIAMSVKVLKLVNSAFFGLPNHVSSPSQAVSLLGLDTIQSLVLMVGIFSQFEETFFRTQRSSLEQLQKHSLGTAVFAQALAKHEGLTKRGVDEAFIAGLLHDVGKLVLLANLPNQCTRVSQLIRENHVAPAVAEVSVLGATHAEVGAYLLGLWGFTDPIVEAGAFHHSPSVAKEHGFTVVTAVHVANIFEHRRRRTIVSDDWDRIDVNHLRNMELEEKLVHWHDTCMAIRLEGE